MLIRIAFWSIPLSADKAAIVVSLAAATWFGIAREGALTQNCGYCF